MWGPANWPFAFKLKLESNQYGEFKYKSNLKCLQGPTNSLDFGNNRLKGNVTGGQLYYRGRDVQELAIEFFPCF